MKNLLAPSILSFDLVNLAQSVPQLMRGGADLIHLDVMDGRWVPPITFGDVLVKSLRRHTDAFLEAHLMVEDPESQFQAFADAGCGRILFHVEGERHAHRLVQRLRTMNVQPGVVLNPGTPIEAVKELVSVVDMVLIMTVDPGWGGQPMIPQMLDKVRALRAMRSDLMIEVDGGVDATTVHEAKSAGANVFVVGSHLARQNDYEVAAREFKRLLE